MAIYSFGSGTLWGTRTDTANATPVKFGALQNITVEFSATNKQLYGQYQFPLAVARGQGKMTGKAKLGQIQGRLFSDLYFGGTLQTGQVTTANGEAVTAAASVSVANAASFVADLGVVNAATGLPLTKVASGPATGQYSVSTAGVYAFNAADVTAGLSLLISYTYGVAGSGQKLVMGNALLGVQPVFQVALETTYNGPSGLKKAVLTLNACVSSKLSLALKNDDFTVPELDFDAFADAAGNLFTWSFSEAS